MANMKVASVQQASLVVGLLAMATDGDGLSGDSQVKNVLRTVPPIVTAHTFCA